MEEDKNTKPLLSYEEVIEIIDECISRDEPIARDERIARMEKAAAQMEADRRKKRGVRGMVRFFKRFWTNLYWRVRACFGK
jgi:hypothetical protein